MSKDTALDSTDLTQLIVPHPSPVLWQRLPALEATFALTYGLNTPFRAFVLAFGIQNIQHFLFIRPLRFKCIQMIFPRTTPREQHYPPFPIILFARIV